jgi:hypothetical protein
MTPSPVFVLGGHQTSPRTCAARRQLRAGGVREYRNRLVFNGALTQLLPLVADEHEAHEGGFGGIARGLSWMTVLLGAALLASFSVATGIFCVRSPAVPRWLGFMFLLFLPSTVALAFIHRVGAALPIACLSSVGFLLCRYGPRRQIHIRRIRHPRDRY